MVRDWGLSPRLGPVGFGSEGPAYLGSGSQLQSRPYAEGTQQVIDEEVTRLLSEAEDRARSLLSSNRAALDAVIAALLERETISGEDLTGIVAASKTAGGSPKAPSKVELSVAGATHEASRTESSDVALNRPRT
jgi:cell division protease FtsH